MNTKRFLTALLVSLFTVILFVACSNQSAEDNEAETQEMNEEVEAELFVSADGTQFKVNGESFRFAGTNNYYMNYKDDAMIDDVIMDAKDMGLEVIRVWAYLDGLEGSMKDNNAYMQTEPGVYDQIPEGARNGFEALDYTLKRAAEEGIYVVMVFIF